MNKIIHAVATISFFRGNPKKDYVVKFWKNSPNEIDVAFRRGDDRHVNVNSLRKYKVKHKIKLGK